MFPMNLFDAMISDHVRKMRQVNCFGWMREGISRTLGGRFGRRAPEQQGQNDTN